MTPGSASVDQNPEKAILLMVAAMLLIPCMDALAKILSDSVPAGQIAWSRFFFQTALLAPFVLFGGHFRRRPRLLLHALRGTLIALATLLFFSALRVMPMADAISIFFVEPLILTLFSALFLGEAIGWRRLSTVGLGFVGALVIIRPSYQVFGWQALLPLGTAVVFATYLLITRKLALQEDAATMQFFAGLFGTLVMSTALLFGALADVPVIDPVWPSALEWVLMAGIGVIATTAHILIVHAFRQAQAAVLAPFQYLEIISATILGFLIFGDFPDPMTWLGVSIIVGSGVYVFHRERRFARMG